MNEEHIEADPAKPEGIPRTALMRGGPNSAKVFGYQPEQHPPARIIRSIHGRNSEQRFAIGAGHGKGIDREGMNLPCSCEGPTCTCS